MRKAGIGSNIQETNYYGQRFTLHPDRWYVCEFIGDEFDEDKCSYSPIKVYRVEPGQNGKRTFRLHFHHANYPEGVRDKAYTLRMIERGTSLLIAKSEEHDPPRCLQNYDITTDWISTHFSNRSPTSADIQQCLDRNTNQQSHVLAYRD